MKIDNKIPFLLTGVAVFVLIGKNKSLDSFNAESDAAKLKKYEKTYGKEGAKVRLKLLKSIKNSLGDMGLFLDPINGFDFCNNCDIHDEGETNVVAVILGIFLAVFAVMLVFIVIAYVIRVKQ